MASVIFFSIPAFLTDFSDPEQIPVE